MEAKNLLSDRACISFSRNRHQEYLRFFSTVKDLVYRADIAQLLPKLGVPQYEPKDWILFIGSTKRSLKCVLLHNGNQSASVPIAHLTTQKEKYQAVKYVLEKISYDQHKWFICVDLKMVNFLLEPQSGFTKYPCFLYVWDRRNRAQYYMKRDWPLQEELVPCKERNVINDPRGDRDRVLFPLLHIKLSLIKLFTCARLFQDWPWRSWKLASWRASDPAAHKRSRVRKLNEQSGTGSVEGIFSSSEELSWQQ